MPNQPYTQLRGITDVNDDMLGDIVERSLIAFFDWASINAGGFFNVPFGTLSPYNSVNANRLRLSEHNRAPTGCVWESFRKNWVWESGLDYTDESPVHITGIKINGSGFPLSTTGVYSYNIDYVLGQVVFNNPIPTGSIVEAEFSHKYFYFESARADWFKELMYRSFRVDDPSFQQYGSGMWTTLAQNRLQMPAIVVEVLPKRSWTGKQLGGGKWANVGVQFHIFTENPTDLKIIDILTYQEEKTIFTLDFESMRISGLLPLDYNGFLQSGARSYPALVDNFSQRKMWFKDMTGYEVESMWPHHRAIVRCTMVVNMPEL